MTNPLVRLLTNRNCKGFLCSIIYFQLFLIKVLFIKKMYLYLWTL